MRAARTSGKDEESARAKASQNRHFGIEIVLSAGLGLRGVGTRKRSDAVSKITSSVAQCFLVPCGAGRGDEATGEESVPSSRSPR